MGVKRIKQISLIFVAISLTALSRSQNIHNITNLECYNDYQSKMFCSWQIVGSSNNCEDFALTSADYNEIEKRCKDLQNEQFDGSAVPNRCTCNFEIQYFVYNDIYIIKVESHGQLLSSTRIDIAFTVKPRPPSNVRIDFEEEQNGLVQWDVGYEGNFIRDKLSFHIQILIKHSREVAKQDFVSRLEPRHTFSKRQLKRGEEYVVRVRMKPEEKQGFKGMWSEWSPEAEWRNDYSLTLQDLKNVLIPITCISVLCLIIVTYVCFIRYKKWWNDIPNPAKSKLAQMKQLQKQPLNPQGKSSAKKSCFFTRIVKAHKSRCDKLPQPHNNEDYVNILGSYYFNRVFFEPEEEDIERCVKMYLKKENENPIEEDKMEHKAEDHLLEPGDLSIAKMFFDIICDTSGIKVDTFENFNTGTSFGCSNWMDSFGKKETQRCNSNVSTFRESEYNSYGSNDYPLDFLANIDRLNNSHIEQWPKNEIDCIPYMPPVSVKERCLYEKEWDHSESPSYNNFSSALYDAKKDLITDISKTFCLDHVSNTIMLFNSSHKRLLTPKSILYYNTKYSFHSIMKPKPQQVSENTFNYYKGKSDPSSTLHVSGYQSFEQAVQENHAEFGCDTSGYKSFDQAVLEGGPDSGCQMSGYQSFDQAVQQGDVTSIHQVTGYQSFDQAVQKNETSGLTNCSVGYRPLEDLVFKNSECSVMVGFENDEQYQLEESHCQNNTELPQTETFIDVKVTSHNKTINDSRKHELLSSGLTRFWLEDIANSTKEHCHPCKDISDKSFTALKIAMDTYLDEDPTVTHEKSPFALTFDICEHLRNLENMNYSSLILPCHLHDIQCIQEQLTINKHLTSPSTMFGTFENLSYFVPRCDLEALGPSQQTKHLLIQQINVDKDGNSYMKLALP